MIESVHELEDRLSRPSPADIAAVSKMSGDFLILGVAGKIGPSLALRLRRAVDEAGVHARVIGVDQSLGADAERQFPETRIETICADLLDPEQVAQLPEAENVVFMAGRKFGSTGAPSLTWAVNAWLPALAARRYRNSRIVAFSSGNVYPMTPVVWGGATEATPPQPVGEYAQSVLARERLFEHFSSRYRTAVCLLRLNYAIDLRYGVLLDIGRKVYKQCPLNLGMGAVNMIWQGDVNSACLRSFAFCRSPPAVLNLTGPETLSVRAIARRFGELLSVEPIFEGVEAEVALLDNAGRYHRLLGYPSVSVDQMIEWVARWLQRDGATLDRPTHFDTRDGKF
jgi:nucleoside-diphosphate-sugar epimerase